MKKILSFISLGVLSSVAFSQNNSLIVKVNGIKEDEGQIRIALYNSESTFMKKTYEFKSAKARKGVVHTTFKDLPRQTYAISVYHDTDNDGELDKGWFGIPSEPYGFSNNPQELMGSPSFKQTSFLLDPENNIIEIELFKKSFF